MPSTHYHGSDSTEDVFKFPGEPRPVTRVVKGLHEVEDGVYEGWISHNKVKYIVRFTVGVDKHFRVLRKEQS